MCSPLDHCRLPPTHQRSTVVLAQVSRDIAAGLAYLHPDVVHRDLKPQNVLLDLQASRHISSLSPENSPLASLQLNSVAHKDCTISVFVSLRFPQQGRAKIADFGISRAKDQTKSYLTATQQGGSPNYMAPGEHYPSSTM